MNALNPIKQILRDIALLIYGGPFRACIKVMPPFWVYRLAEVLAFFFFIAIKDRIDAVSKGLCEFVGGS